MGKRFILKINRNHCKGCRLCVEVCPQTNLVLSSNFGKAGYHYAEETGGKCTGCRKCAIICPDAAVEIYIENTGDRSSEENEPAAQE